MAKWTIVVFHVRKSLIGFKCFHHNNNNLLPLHFRELQFFYQQGRFHGKKRVKEKWCSFHHRLCSAPDVRVSCDVCTQQTPVPADRRCNTGHSRYGILCKCWIFWTDQSPALQTRSWGRRCANNLNTDSAVTAPWRTEDIFHKNCTALQRLNNVK